MCHHYENLTWVSPHPSIALPLSFSSTCSLAINSGCFYLQEEKICTGIQAQAKKEKDHHLSQAFWPQNSSFPLEIFEQFFTKPRQKGWVTKERGNGIINPAWMLYKWYSVSRYSMNRILLSSCPMHSTPLCIVFSSYGHFSDLSTSKLAHC